MVGRPMWMTRVTWRPCVTAVPLTTAVSRQTHEVANDHLLALQQQYHGGWKCGQHCVLIYIPDASVSS